MQQWIINAIGPDRPGIVGEVAGHLHSAGANVLDSRMVNLRGQFAIIVLFEAPRSAAGSLRDSLPNLGRSTGLHLSLVETRAAAPAVRGVPFKLKTYSMDQPGIVHRISEVLRKRGVNIEDLATRQESAPFAGTPLFLMELRITVPPAVPIHDLRGELQSLCDSLNCDMDFEPG